MSHCSVGLGTNPLGIWWTSVRPAMTPDGAVLVGDDANGVIYRVV